MIVHVFRFRCSQLSIILEGRSLHVSFRFCHVVNPSFPIMYDQHCHFYYLFIEHIKLINLKLETSSHHSNITNHHSTIMSYVPPPEDFDVIESPPRLAKKPSAYRDTESGGTPNTAASSKISSLGSPVSSAGSKRTIDTVDPPSLKRASITVDDSSKTSTKKSVHSLKLGDLASSDSEDAQEDSDDDEDIAIPDVHWDDIDLQKKWNMKLYGVDNEEDVPTTIEELVEKNIKKLKAPDLQLALFILKPGTKCPTATADMRAKLTKMVKSALEKKARMTADAMMFVDVDSKPSVSADATKPSA